MVGFTAHMQESAATEDAIDYLIMKNKREEAIEAHKILYPAYASYIGSLFGFTGYVVAIAHGHWYGRYKADLLEEQFKHDDQLKEFRETSKKPTAQPVDFF